ncbi:MAG: FtsQ-type POTRA domain-containing protein [Gemmatimonadetes bacterium]|nr:FtsQ-type POTRA domain-containing protein [Gemmatimonadota bacterium]
MIALAERLTRRARRRVFVVLTAGALGLAVPVWVPRLLATLPAFQVAEVRVAGTRYVAPAEITRLARLTTEASVWDDRSEWEARVRAHPMVRDATIRRHGFRALEIVVVEKRPVALVATPELLPVNAEGRLLPIDVADARLDLPVIGGIADVVDDTVRDPAVRELAGVIDRLARADADFASVVSEVSYTEDGSYRFLMLPSADAGVVLLPRERPVRALERVSLALGQVTDPRVVRADARFSGQVVLTRAEGR